MKQNNDFDESLENEENAFTALTPSQLQAKSIEQVKDFGELLDSLDITKDKKKKLWKAIFENAVQDRQNAYILFMDLLVSVHTKPEQHAIHGQNLSKYLEKMSKATDQLLKLAELVANAEEKMIVKEEEESEEEVDPDKLYEQINSAAQSNKK